jgi:hypothetical protein
MKIRNSFVSNSSSCSFVVINKTGNVKTIEEFLKDNLEYFPTDIQKKVKRTLEYDLDDGSFEGFKDNSFGEEFNFIEIYNASDFADLFLEILEQSTDTSNW